MQAFGPVEAIGAAVAAELPFAKKIHLLASLVRLSPTSRSFGTGGKDPNEVFAAVLADCLRAEELRNTVMHSSWESVPLEPERMLRFKHSAKAKRGLHTQLEHLDSAMVLDVADFVDHAAAGLEIFFAPPIVEL